MCFPPQKIHACNRHFWFFHTSLSNTHFHGSYLHFSISFLVQASYKSLCWNNYVIPLCIFLCKYIQYPLCTKKKLFVSQTNKSEVFYSCTSAVRTAINAYFFQCTSVLYCLKVSVFVVSNRVSSLHEARNRQNHTIKGKQGDVTIAGIIAINYCNNDIGLSVICFFLFFT